MLPLCACRPGGGKGHGQEPPRHQRRHPRDARRPHRERHHRRAPHRARELERYAGQHLPRQGEPRAPGHAGRVHRRRARARRVPPRRGPDPPRRLRGVPRRRPPRRRCARPTRTARPARSRGGRRRAGRSAGAHAAIELPTALDAEEATTDDAASDADRLAATRKPPPRCARRDDAEDSRIHRDVARDAELDAAEARWRAKQGANRDEPDEAVEPSMYRERRGARAAEPSPELVASRGDARGGRRRRCSTTRRLAHVAAVAIAGVMRACADPAARRDRRAIEPSGSASCAASDAAPRPRQEREERRARRPRRPESPRRDEARATGQQAQAGSPARRRRGPRRDDSRARSRHGEPPRISKSTPIRDVVREGQEIIVQISKEPIGTKGARVHEPHLAAGPLRRLPADGRSRRHLASASAPTRSARACARRSRR